MQQHCQTTFLTALFTLFTLSQEKAQWVETFGFEGGSVLEIASFGSIQFAGINGDGKNN